MVRNTTDTRRQVLAAARNLLSNHGYNGTSLQDILDAVGITKGAFYYYFKGKETLCQTVLEQAIEDYHHLAEVVQNAAAEPDSLSRWLTLMIRQNTEGQWLNFRLLTRLTIECAELNTASQDKLSAFWQWYQGFYETLIRQSLGQSGTADKDVPVLARSLICGLFGALWLDHCAPSQNDLTCIAQAQLGLFLK